MPTLGFRWLVHGDGGDAELQVRVGTGWEPVPIVYADTIEAEPGDPGFDAYIRGVGYMKNGKRIDPPKEVEVGRRQTHTIATLTQGEIRQEQRVMGFTGNVCVQCGGTSMVRNGPCQLCTSCGHTTGCS